MPSETGSTDNRRIVEDCVICGRTHWSWVTCYHGKVPPPDKTAPKERGVDGLKGGVETRRGK